MESKTGQKSHLFRGLLLSTAQIELGFFSYNPTELGIEKSRLVPAQISRQKNSSIDTVNKFFVAVRVLFYKQKSSQGHKLQPLDLTRDWMANTSELCLQLICAWRGSHFFPTNFSSQEIAACLFCHFQNFFRNLRLKFEGKIWAHRRLLIIKGQNNIRDQVLSRQVSSTARYASQQVGKLGWLPRGAFLNQNTVNVVVVGPLKYEFAGGWKFSIRFDDIVKSFWGLTGATSRLT